MQHLFNRIVILLNDLENMETLLAKGVNFANEHNALLEVLFVHEVPLFQVPDFFLPKDKITEDLLDKEKVKESIEQHLKSLALEKEHVIFVYNNDSIDRLSTLIKEPEKTLVLTQYHAELSAKLIEETAFTFWIIKRKRVYKNIAFPIDLEDKFKANLALVEHLFPEATPELIHNYRYMLDPLVTSQDYFIVAPVTTEVDMEVNKILREKKMETFNAYLEEYPLKGAFIEGDGVFNDDLIKYIKEHSFDLSVLDRENEDIFFTPTLIKELMEEISTDFFVR